MKRIVIIGSAQCFVENRQGLFRRGNFSVRTAKDAAAGLLLLEQEPADLVIADLHDPAIPGDELCARIAGMGGGADMAVLLLCSDKRRDVDRCQSCGATTFIAGAITAATLFARTAELLQVATRRDYRVLTRVSIEGRLGEYGDVPFFGTMRDISASGLLLETGKSINVGDKLICSFFLDGKNLSLRGEVIRISQDLCGQQYGIQYLDLDDETRYALISFITGNLH